MVDEKIKVLSSHACIFWEYNSSPLLKNATAHIAINMLEYNKA